MKDFFHYFNSTSHCQIKHSVFLSVLKEPEVLSKYLGTRMVRGQGLWGEKAQSLLLFLLLWAAAMPATVSGCEVYSGFYHVVPLTRDSYCHFTSSWCKCSRLWSDLFGEPSLYFALVPILIKESVCQLAVTTIIIAGVSFAAKSSS